MAYANFGPVVVPPIHVPNGTAPAYRSTLMDASAEKVAVIFRVPKTGTLDKFEFCLGTVTQAPANGLKCSFQDVSTTNGQPDGTGDQFRVVTSGLTSNAWVAPGLMTDDGTDGGVKRSVTEGDLIACVIEFQSFSASDSLNINMLDVASVSNSPYPHTLNEYVYHFTAAWGEVNAVPGIALKYNDGTYGHIPWAWPASAVNTEAFDSSTTPDEIGLYFQNTVPTKVNGAVVLIERTASRDVSVILYDSDGTSALATTTGDMDISPSASGGNAVFKFSSAVSLAKDTNYRLVVRPDTAVTNRIYSISVNAAAILDTLPGGSNWHQTHRTNAGAWTQTTTKRPFIHPIFSAFDDGVSTGGPVGHSIGMG